MPDERRYAVCRDLGAPPTPLTGGRPVLRGRDRKGPKGYTRSDERIREEICEQLAADRRVDVSEVGVQVTNGCVTLEGEVPERFMKHRIEDTADNCWGVNDVDNRIRVTRESPSQTSVARARQPATPAGPADASVSGTANPPMRSD